MDYYAGLDVSLEETAICVVDGTGRIVKEARAASEPDALAAALNQLDLPLERIGLEACSLTAWLHDGLREVGLPAICIETRSIENVARAILREAGLKLGTPGRAAFATRVRELAGDDPQVMPLVDPLLTVLAAMLTALARLTKQVMDLVKKETVCRRLMSVPGVGPITALAFRATIDRPDRFKRSRDVGAHLGLTPARYQSGETDIQGKISRCGDELARTALYEAAHTLLVRSKKWSSLRAWGMNVARHRGMARARVAVARKLAVILHRMWSDGAEFRWGKDPANGAMAGA